MLHLNNIDTIFGAAKTFRMSAIASHGNVSITSEYHLTLNVVSLDRIFAITKEFGEHGFQNLGRNQVS